MSIKFIRGLTFSRKYDNIISMQFVINSIGRRDEPKNLRLTNFVTMPSVTDIWQQNHLKQRQKEW